MNTEKSVIELHKNFTKMCQSTSTVNSQYITQLNPEQLCNWVSAKVILFMEVAREAHNVLIELATLKLDKSTSLFITHGTWCLSVFCYFLVSICQQVVKLLENYNTYTIITIYLQLSRSPFPWRLLAPSSTAFPWWTSEGCCLGCRACYSAASHNQSQSTWSTRQASTSYWHSWYLWK